MGLFTSVPEYPQSVDRRVGNAFHEASHAEGFQAAGYRVRQIELELDGFQGVTRPGPGHPESPEQATVGFLVGITAGRVGEARWLKRESSLSWGAALRLATSKCPGDMELFALYNKQLRLSEDKAMQLARDLVNQRWGRIKSLADKLLRKGVVKF